jgi:acyl-CoA synthetase (AMP-forming)/AMP-acid ligase II/acyl carrier protein
MLTPSSLVSIFSQDLFTYSNSFLSLESRVSSFVYLDSIEKIRERSYLFDSIDPEKRPVLLFNQDSSEFVVNLLACWLSNRPIVPVCLPSKKRMEFINFIIEETGSMIYAIDSNHSQVFNLRSSKTSLLCNLAEVVHDSFSPLPSSFVNRSKPAYPSSTAVIQYSSGSTGAPKGVLITTHNMHSSLVLMTRIWNITSQSSFYSWLPLYHDLGLIFGILLPLFNGCRSYIISSPDFAKKPSIWLSHLSSFEISHTAGSTSGYAMASLQEYPSSVCLEHCEYSMIAAEHISSTVISRFLDIAIPLGLRRTALSAAYGLAESTLAVAADRIQDSLFTLAFDQSALNTGHAIPSPNGRVLVSSGYALPETKISIRNNGLSLPFGAIGEVVIEGPTVMHGYLGNLDAPPLLELYTGDLGFLYDDYLFITGRKKELIIINGKNIYPEDVEQSVKSELDLLVDSTSVCFSIQNDDCLDAIVFIAELNRHVTVADPVLVLGKINDIIINISGRDCHDILFVKRAQIPKTTSGKLQRLKARELYLSNQFKVIHSFKSYQFTSPLSLSFTSEELLSWLHNYGLQKNETVLRSLRGQTFISLDSLGASELKNFIKNSTGVLLDDTFIWEFDTVDKLLHHILSELN